MGQDTAERVQSEVSPLKDGADVDISDDEDHDLGVFIPRPITFNASYAPGISDLKRKREDSEFGIPADDSESKRFKKV